MHTKLLCGKPEGKRPHGKGKNRWKDDDKIDLKETGCEGVKWIHLAQDRNQRRALVNTIKKLLMPKNAENFLASYDTTSFSIMLLRISVL
jgi:hypothetical protein